MVQIETDFPSIYIVRMCTDARVYESIIAAYSNKEDAEECRKFFEKEYFSTGSSASTSVWIEKVLFNQKITKLKE